MKIAFISYEYPPDTACGGIATYVEQAAQILRHRGHHVEVFTGSLQRQGTEEKNGILIHRIVQEDRHRFPQEIGSVFAERQLAVGFDVVEGPDIFAEGREVMRLFPAMPMVVKLHIPTFLIDRINRSDISLYRQTRWVLSTLRRGHNPFKNWQYQPQTDIECIHAQNADEVVILTKEMGDQVMGTWDLKPEQVSQIPNPYVPSERLLNIPIDTQTGMITFIGRLEPRKGVIDLAKAIPQVLQHHPTAKFRLIGRSLGSPNPKLDMQQYLKQLLGKHQAAVEFIGSVPLADIPHYLGETDICAFPSIWENFPNVCLEAMAAGRGVIGSWAGGMAEMLDGGKAGKLVEPRRPDQIANAIIALLDNPTERMHLGQQARDRVLAEYNCDRIGALLEASYLRAIQHRQRLGSRQPNFVSPIAK